AGGPGEGALGTGSAADPSGATARGGAPSLPRRPPALRRLHPDRGPHRLPGLRPAGRPGGPADHNRRRLPAGGVFAAPGPCGTPNGETADHAVGGYGPAPQAATLRPLRADGRAFLRLPGLLAPVALRLTPALARACAGTVIP